MFFGRIGGRRTTLNHLVNDRGSFDPFKIITHSEENIFRETYSSYEKYFTM